MISSAEDLNLEETKSDIAFFTVDSAAIFASLMIPLTDRLHTMHIRNLTLWDPRSANIEKFAS
jgi:hypothetical protein